MEKIIKINHDCPLCDTIHEVEQITRITSSNIKGDVVEHEEKVFRCPKRVEEWYHGKMLDDTLLYAKDAYRVKHNLLTSDDIKSIRKKYKLTQKELSNLLGLGSITISRYETTHIQDEIYDTALREVMKNPSFAFDELIKHKGLFLEERFYEIQSVLKTAIKNEGVTELKRQEIQRRYIDYDTECDANGFRLINIDKISDIIAYFANYTNKLFKVKLMKLLWYSDVLYFNKYKRSMTGLVYQHKPLGALPIGYNEIIYLPSITIEEEELESGTSYHILPLSPPINPIFSLEELDVLNQVAIKFRDFNGKEIINYMHNEEAYKVTSEGDIILYSQAYNIVKF